jgi:uncharacterized protein (DUF2252 family)
MIAFREEEVMGRDPLAELIRYNSAFVGDGRDPSWLEAKLERLCASPFGFLRGTFHLFMSDWAVLGDDPLNPGAPVPIVGDLHLENFGAFKTKDGFVFDVNDFDETALGTPAIDLGRVAASFLLADEKHGELRAVSRIEAFLDAYLEAARNMDLRPLTADTSELPSAVVQSIDKALKLSRGEWLDKYVRDDKFVPSEHYNPVSDEARAAVTEVARGWGQPLDVAVRIAGTGSLGRFRYAVLLTDAEKQKKLVLEFKEARPSSLEPGGASAAQAERVIAQQRLLQGASPRFLATAQILGRAYTVRELQPTDAKLKSESMSGAERDELCASCGGVLGRLHGRGSRDLKARLQNRDRAIARRIAAFALRYADLVCEDYELLKAHVDDVKQSLHISH